MISVSGVNRMIESVGYKGSRGEAGILAPFIEVILNSSLEESWVKAHAPLIFN